MKKRPKAKWVLQPNDKISVLNTVEADAGCYQKKREGESVRNRTMMILDKVNFDQGRGDPEVGVDKKQTGICK